MFELHIIFYVLILRRIPNNIISNNLTCRTNKKKTEEPKQVKEKCLNIFLC